MSKGLLEVICGSMFSGKTEELMRRLRRSEFAKQNVLTIKHQIDNRKSFTSIVSHMGNKREAFSLGSEIEHLQQIVGLANQDVHVIGIDEVQFFPLEIVEVICALIDANKRVIVAGLDLDFRGLPFGIMPTILALADKVTKLNAICMQCGEDAFYTQRLINGKPAKFSDPIIFVGAEECYEARCRACFSIDKPIHHILRSKTQSFSDCTP